MLYVHYQAFCEIMADLIHIVYVSFSSISLTEKEIIDLLTEVRKKNKEQNVTGLLLYNNESFIQVIEGSKKTIHALFEKIKQDNRHENVVKLLEEPIKKRAFPDWSMGFRQITSKQTARIPGFSSFMFAETSETAIQKSTQQVIYLLNQFKVHT